MLRQIMVLTLLVCLFGSSCNTSQEKTLLRKATKVHQESATIEADIDQKLRELIQKKNSINIQGRALTTEELTFVDIIENLESTYNDWRKNYESSASMHALSQNKVQKNRTQCPQQQLRSQCQRCVCQSGESPREHCQFERAGRTHLRKVDQ